MILPENFFSFLCNWQYKKQSLLLFKKKSFIDNIFYVLRLKIVHITLDHRLICSKSLRVEATDDIDNLGLNGPRDGRGTYEPVEILRIRRRMKSRA